MKSISTSDNKTRQCRLVVKDITGINEERGFRLFWDPVPDEGIIIPALGYATSYPFRTRVEAVRYGQKNFGETAVTIK